MKSEVFLSSWDIAKKFHRVPIQARMWTYARLGVPIEIAECMAAFDINCAVVFCILRRWRYDGLRSHGYRPGVGMA